MNEKKIKSPLGQIANPFAVHENIFPNVSNAKFAIRGVLRALFGGGADSGDDFLFFRRTKIRFEEAPEFDLDFDYRRRVLTFVLREPTGADADAVKAQITQELSLDYAARASDGLTRTALSIFLSLDETGRKTLIESEMLRDTKAKSGTK